MKIFSDKQQLIGGGYLTYYNGDKLNGVATSVLLRSNTDNLAKIYDYFYSVFSEGTTPFATTTDFINSVIFFPISNMGEYESIGGGNLKVGIWPFESSLICSVSKTSYTYRLCYFKYEPPFNENDYRNYGGFTKLKLYLPFFGLVDLNPNDVIGKYIQIFITLTPTTPQALYIIATSDIPYDDLGVGNPMLDRDKSYDFSNMDLTPLHFLEFTLGVTVPFGRVNNDDMIRNGLMSAANIATSIGFATAKIPAIASTALSTTSSTTTKTRVNPKTNKPTSKITTNRKATTTSTRETDRSEYERSRRINDCFRAGISALNVFEQDTATTATGNSNVMLNMGKNVGLIVYLPKIVEPDEDFNHLYGQPYGAVSYLSQFEGYTEISDVHIEGNQFNHLTETEKAMLEDALINGIIL